MLVGRVPSRGGLLAYSSECQISELVLSDRPPDGIALAVTMSRGLSMDRHDQLGAHGLPQAPANRPTLGPVDSAAPSNTITPAPVTPP